MTFPLPPGEAAFIAEIVRQLDGRLVGEVTEGGVVERHAESRGRRGDAHGPTPPSATSPFQIPVSAQLEIDQQRDEAA